MPRRSGRNKSYAKNSKRIWSLFFNKLLEHIDAYVMVTDSRGNVEFANRKYSRFFGSHAAGRKWINCVIPEGQRKEVEKIFAGIKKAKTLCGFDSPAVVKDGKKKCISWTALPLRRDRAAYYMFIGKLKRGGQNGSAKGHRLTSEKVMTGHKKVIDHLFSASMISEPETASHAARVMLISVALAKKLKLSNSRIERLKVAALLHDLGKLAIDEKILFKKGRLNKNEFSKIKEHPHWGAGMVGLIYFLDDIIPIMSCHHENYDGSGYPAGIEGKDIPMEARILSVADIYEALTADRPYRKGFSKKKAIAIIESEKGRKLDPVITDIFLDMVRRGALLKYAKSK